MTLASVKLKKKMDQHMLLLPLGKEGLYLLTLVRHNKPGTIQHRSLSGSEEENKEKIKLGENAPPPRVHHRPAGSILIARTSQEKSCDRPLRHAGNGHGRRPVSVLSSLSIPRVQEHKTRVPYLPLAVRSKRVVGNQGKLQPGEAVSAPNQSQSLKREAGVCPPLHKDSVSSVND